MDFNKERKDFERRYIKLYLQYISPDRKQKQCVRGLLKQMDVQRYFEDYTDRHNGADLVWNNYTFEIKTGFRFVVAYRDKWINTDYVIWSPSVDIGSITDWRVYRTDDFLDACMPYLQKTIVSKRYKAMKIKDGTKEKLQGTLDEIPYRYLDNFIE